MSNEGDRIRELIEIERDIKTMPQEEPQKVVIQLQPIEFNTFVGHQPPTREEIGRAIIQEIENDNFYYHELIKHVKEEVQE
jgi:hypothetical protein